MTVSMYDVCVPAVVHTLGAMSTILDKAIAHCAAKKIEPAVLVNYRLAIDMFPLSRQIQIMTDQAKGMGARLTGIDVPSYADTEVTLEDLKARIAKTVAFLNGLKADQFKDSATRDIKLKVGPNELDFKGLQYATGFVFPNFYFHATAAYAILRHAGVDVGKRDFLGA